MQRLLLSMLLMLLVAAPFASAEKRIALVIGNSNYAKKSWVLTNPAHDAALVGDALKAVGFEVFTLQDGTEKQMELAFKAHGDRLKAAGPDAVGFFYFAGHGVQSEGLNYLVPTDINATEEADIWSNAPRIGDLMRHLNRAGNATNFLVIDACRDNPLRSSVRNLGGGLAKQETSRGTLIAFATEPGRVALDGTGRNSPYAVALASVMRDSSDPVEVMFRKVATRVEEATGDPSRPTRAPQQPWFESGLRGEQSFCFRKCGQAAPVASEETELGRALASGSVSVLSDCLGKFPNSRSRGIVEEKITELQQPDQPVSAEREALGRALLGLFAYGQKDYLAARDHLTAGCYDGAVANACLYLGRIYLYGHGVKADPIKGALLVNKSCERGQINGCVDLGDLYTLGMGVRRDFERARHWYELGCEGEVALGCERLGTLSEIGSGGERDYKVARQYYKRACDADAKVGCSPLGRLHRLGLGGRVDSTLAKQLFERACQSGDTSGCDALAESP